MYLESRLLALGLTAALCVAFLSGCGPTAATASKGKVDIVAAENEYGNVASQIGGRYVTVASIMSDPNTDPHEFQASTSIASLISGAQILIQNGLGYDDFMTKLASASPNSDRRLINAQRLLGLPDRSPNPHLWYNPRTMPAVASKIAATLANKLPRHSAYFRARARKFVASLRPWLRSISNFKSAYHGTKVATMEPVADYMLNAAGVDILTPPSFEQAIMNGIDPSPQEIAAQTDRLTHGKVDVLVYNQQVTDSLTESFLSAAHAGHVPIVGVYETMPTPGYTYQSWMVAEMGALERAVVHHHSTQKL